MHPRAILKAKLVLHCSTSRSRPIEYAMSVTGFLRGVWPFGPLDPPHTAFPGSKYLEIH